MDEDQKKCAGISCGSFMVITLSIAMIIIGCLNVNLEEIDVSANVKDSNVTSDTCKIEPKIPFFLIVAGILNIALLILRAIFQRCCRKCCDGDNGDNAACATCGFLANCACISIFDTIALTLIVIWLVIGSYWIFPHWDAISEDTNETKCRAYLYWFSVTVTIISWISVAFAVLCGILCTFCECFWSILCCKPCRNADNQPV